MKKFLPDLIAILAFIILSFAYFFPAVIENRSLFQHDTVAGAGAGQETKEYRELTGESSRWTNSLFGGMPTYQISPSYDSTESLRVAEQAYQLFLPKYVWLMFIMMLGFYILLRAFGMSAWLSTIGAVMWGLSSYFFILISAGHIWKFVTLAYIPPTIAGIVLAYRKQYLLGGLVTAFFFALQILSNHIQMTYYFLFVILFMVIAYFVEAYRNRQLPSFFKATAVLFVSALVGVAVNSSNLYHTYEYSKHTMRGKSELTFEGDKAAQTSSGLDRDYITQWSYGIGETMSLWIPNIRGGASVPLSQSEAAMKKANPLYTQNGLYNQLTQYFGDQPMTSGPVYVGAFVMALFILGCFIVKGPMKWALLGATIFSILLSWGRNFMPLTDFFIDYVPMYNKFRAVSSILVIAEFTIPLLAVFALKEIIQHPETIRKHRAGYITSFAITGGSALILALAPNVLISNFIPAAEMNALQQGLPAEHLAPLMVSLQEMRMALVSADAWKTLLIVLCGYAFIEMYVRKTLKPVWVIGGILLLCLIEMWAVNKRYLNDSQFVPESTQLTKTFKQSAADKEILKDKTQDYRVLNFATSTFNENNTSYWHKSVGGYHAAKLRRYQEMIERYIAPQMQVVGSEISAAQGDMSLVDGSKFNVLNMLNTKYFIFPINRQGETAPILNPYAFGNAWFVNDVVYVNNANEEIDETGKVNPRTTAVVDARFKEALKNTQQCPDSTASIQITSYAPNRLVYETNAANDGVVVFSEIYYPGWEATIDGVPARVARADYILRAMYVPAGQHTIEMVFKPHSVTVTETIAYIAFAIMVLGALALIGSYFVARRKAIKKLD